MRSRINRSKAASAALPKKLTLGLVASNWALFMCETKAWFEFLSGLRASGSTLARRHRSPSPESSPLSVGNRKAGGFLD
jgi:hypothetical protein